MKSSTKSMVTAIVIAAVIIGAFAISFSDITMTATFWSLVPPVVAIALALITKEVYSSLFIGVLVGAIFAADGSITKTVDLTINDGLISAISGTAGIFLFLVLLGAIVALINRAGGSAAFGEWAKVHIKTRVGAQLATFVLGVLIFIDDYFNCLTVGSVMMPVTDSHKISRAKFSYLIDATAAPVCMIAPVSSWAAAVSSTASDLNAGISGIELFIKAIPFNFYSLLTLVFIVTLVLLKVDYGPMAKHEKNAIENGDTYASSGPEITELYYEDGRVYIKCSDAAAVHLYTAGRRRARTPEIKDGKPITEASFEVKESDFYFRLTVKDAQGNYANTRAYFLDELK